MWPFSGPSLLEDGRGQCWAGITPYRTRSHHPSLRIAHVPHNSNIRNPFAFGSEMMASVCPFLLAEPGTGLKNLAKAVQVSPPHVPTSVYGKPMYELTCGDTRILRFGFLFQLVAGSSPWVAPLWQGRVTRSLPVHTSS